LSEIVQGALIGISGAIVGAVITAIIAYINTKSQLNLRIYELKTDRLIKTREGVLIPLRKALNMWSEYSTKEMILMVQMGEASKKDDKTELKIAIKRWEEAANKRDEARFDLKMLVGQLSDSQLLQMIKEVETAQTNENSKVIEITFLAHKPESMNFETMKKLNEEAQKFHNITLNKLLPVNKRIEELLSGEPSK
jgi:hypothetical protein